MSSYTHNPVFARGQRLDLHVVTLRDRAETSFGELYQQAVDLRHNLDNPEFSEDEYDARVVGLICSALVRVKPLPKRVREGLGYLLSLSGDSRFQTIKSPAIGDPRSFDVRSDKMLAEIVIDAFVQALYPKGSYATGLTDLASGLEGLHLTWRKDVLAEANSEGIISVEGLNTIREKLALALTAPLLVDKPILLDANGKVISSSDDEWVSDSVRRRYELVEVIETAVSLKSPVRCIPSSVREERIQEAYRTQLDTLPPAHKHISPLSPTDRTPFDKPQIYSVLRPGQNGSVKSDKTNADNPKGKAAH